MFEKKKVLQSIENKLDVLIQSDKHIEIERLQQSIRNLQNKYDDSQIIEKLNEINQKIDGLYFENELVKHQLLVEEQVRKCNQEVDSLQTKVQLIIDDIVRMLEMFQSLKN